MRSDILSNTILECIVREYVDTAQTVSSMRIVEKYGLQVSSATVRNIMSRLEEKGLLTHTHVSSGRIPTNKGMKYYVDTLMKNEDIPRSIRDAVDSTYENVQTDLEYVLRLTSRLISKLSEEIGVVLSPLLFNGVLEDIELVELAGNRFLLILQIDGGIVKTLMVESDSEIEKRRLPVVRDLLRERLRGLSLADVQSRLLRSFSDLPEKDYHLVQKIFHRIENSVTPELHNGSNFEFLEQPEFLSAPSSHSVISLLRTDNWLLKLRRHVSFRERNVQTLFGHEINFIEGDNCGVVMRNFQIKQLEGLLAVVGPARMPYHHIIPLLDLISEKINEKVLERSEY